VKDTNPHLELEFSQAKDVEASHENAHIIKRLLDVEETRSHVAELSLQISH